MFTVGVDLGGTLIRAGLFTQEGRLVERLELPTKAAEGPQAVIGRIKESIYSLWGGLGDEGAGQQIAGIGVGCPGPLNPFTGVVLSPPNLSGWVDVPLRDILMHEFGVPVLLNNDANAAALGEYFYGQGRGINNLVYLTISTGVGAGIICDGKLLLGEHGSAGEIGHMTIDPSGPLCGCGNHGCFEALVSGTGIVRRATAKLQRLRTNSADYVSLLEVGEFSAEDVFQAARMGDHLATAIVEETWGYLGIGLANLVNLYNPKMIVLGGGVSKAGDFLLEPAIAIAQKRALRGLTEGVVFSVTELGADVGLFGAAALVSYSQTGNGKP